MKKIKCLKTYLQENFDNFLKLNLNLGCKPLV